MTLLEQEALALADRLEAARYAGASDNAIAELVLGSGWRPTAEPAGRTDTVYGVLISGRRVPVQVQHARRR